MTELWCKMTSWDSLSTLNNLAVTVIQPQPMNIPGHNDVRGYSLDFPGFSGVYPQTTQLATTVNASYDNATTAGDGDGYKYARNLTRDVLLGLVLFFLSLLTFIGNAMVLHAVRTDRRLQTVRNIGNSGPVSSYKLR